MTIDDEVQTYAETYASEVKARRALGDSNAEYHSREPKIEAYRLLLESGKSAKEAVVLFQKILETL